MSQEDLESGEAGGDQEDCQEGRWVTVSSIAEISFTETHVDLQSSSLLSSSVNICQHLNQEKLYNTDKVDVCLLKREKEYK